MTRKERKRTESPGQQGQQDPQEQTNANPAPGEAGDAYKQLRHAVREKVRQQSEEIAASLVNSTLEGNSSSARIMVSLVEKKKKKNKSREKGKRGHSLALDLASDPQVRPEDDEWSREEERSAREPEALPNADTSKPTNASGDGI